MQRRLRSLLAEASPTVYESGYFSHGGEQMGSSTFRASMQTWASVPQPMSNARSPWDAQIAIDLNPAPP